MDILLSVEDEVFCYDVVVFLKENLIVEMFEFGWKEVGVFIDVLINLKWQKIFYEKGWVVLMWLEEFGGVGWILM